MDRKCPNNTESDETHELLTVFIQIFKIQWLLIYSSIPDIQTDL